MRENWQERREGAGRAVRNASAAEQKQQALMVTFDCGVWFCQLCPSKKAFPTSGLFVKDTVHLWMCRYRRKNEQGAWEKKKKDWGKYLELQNQHKTTQLISFQLHMAHPGGEVKVYLQIESDCSHPVSPLSLSQEGRLALFDMSALLWMLCLQKSKQTNAWGRSHARLTEEQQTKWAWSLES